MGCASSTPMITSGSDMLKAATHVAEDAAKSAENAVQDVSQSLGKTIDTAKETVGTAVTGIAHDLGNAFKDKTDEAKNNLLQTLHLNGERTNQNATGQLQKQHGLDNTNGNGDDNLNDDDDDEITQRLSRAPTPTPLVKLRQQDTDSLKTSTPEPEIEQALANQLGEDNPPTPKPNISELERLSAELHEIKKETDVITTSTSTNNNITSNSEKTSSESTIQRRPGTTEWEKYADTLAKNQKFHPNEIALRRRLIGMQGSLTKMVTTGLLTNGQTTTTTTTTNGILPMGTTLTDTTLPMNANDASTTKIGNPTNNNINNNNTNTSITDIIPNKITAIKNNAPKIIAPQYFRDFTRTKNVKNCTKYDDDDDESAQSDHNNDSTSSSTQMNRSNIRVLRKRIPRAFTTATAKKMHRQLTSLIGSAPEKSTTSATAGFRTHFGRNGNRAAAMVLGRNFDFNPNRLRIGSPVTRKRNAILLPSLRYGESLGHHLNSSFPNNNLRQRPRNAFVSNAPIQRMSSSSTASRIGLHSLGHINSPIGKINNRSISRSSRSSTNNSITLKSNCTTPVSRSASKSSLHNIMPITAINDNTEILDNNKICNKYVAKKLSRTSSPIVGVVEDYCFNGNCGSSLSGCKTPINSPLPMKNTSSFLSSPRTSPFTPRKSYGENDEKENSNNSKAASFIAELSSVTENRNLLTPSPYKMRERCAVCYKKYLVK